jgi:hypothetical protein
MRIERFNLEELMGSAGLDEIVATGPAALRPQAGYHQTRLDEHLGHLRVSAWASDTVQRPSFRLSPTPGVQPAGH